MPNDTMLPDDDASRDDEIVAEVRATRARLGAAVGYDLDRLYEQLKALEEGERARGRMIIAPPSGTGGTSGAAA